MKKLCLAILLLFVFATGCKKESNNTTSNPFDNITVSPIQESFTSLVTATWCRACAWGDSTFDGIVSGHPGFVNAVGLHFSPYDTLYCKAAGDLQNFYNSATYPGFNEGTSTFNNAYTDFESSIEKTISIISPACAIGLAKSISNDTIMTVYTKVHFYSTLPTSSYQIAVYLTEDGIVAPQNNNNVLVTNFVHKRVLRASIAGTNYQGFKIASYPAAGMEFTNAFTTNLNPKWVSSKIHVVAVVYNVFNGQIVQVLNSHSI